MANVTILQLPQANGLTGAEQIEGVQSGTSVRIPLNLIAALGPGPQGIPGPPGIPGVSFLASVYVPASAGALGIQAAYNSFIGTSGGTIGLGPGIFLVGAVPITPVDGVVLQGAGMGVTFIQQTVLSVRAFNLAGNFGSYNYMAFEDFTVTGMWLANQAMGVDNDRHFAINGVDRLRFSNVESVYCRQMAITAGNCGEVLVEGCRVRYCARDCINLTGSRHCIVVNNQISHGYDDAIAIHQTGTTGNPPNEGHIISGNIIEDTFGIKMLGGSKCTITGNTLRRVKGYGIYTQPSGVEGYSDQISVAITGNSITDIINANFFAGGGNLCVGIYVGNASKLFQNPVVGGAIPDINRPEDFYYLSNAAGAQNAGAQGIDISGNTVYGFTLPAAAAYSTWGFGTAFTAAGFVDPDMTTFKYQAQGIRVDGAFLSANITGNFLVGMDSPIVADSTMNILDQLRIAANTFSRFKQFGVGLETSAPLNGRVFIDNNTFDADPYFDHANRTTPIDGTWNTTQFKPAAFDVAAFKGATIRGNSFRNLLRIEHTSGSGASSYEGNTYFMQPDSAATVAAPGIAANKGIYFPDGFGHVSDRLIWEDSNPTSATYATEIGRSKGISSALPTTGYYMAGQFVRSTAFVESGSAASKYTILGWQKLTTGNANTLNTDWRELRCLTGN